jgi:putative membrane protein
MTIVLDVLLTAIFLKIVAAMLPDMEVDGFGPAVITALIMALVGAGISFALAPLLTPSLQIGGWVTYVISFVLSVIILMIALNVVPGVRVRGMGIVVVAAVLLSALRMATALMLHWGQGLLVRSVVQGG